MNFQNMLTRPLLLLVIWVCLTTDLEPTVRADEAVLHWSFQKPVRPTVRAKKQLQHGGRVIGAADDFGFHAVQDKVHVNDLHATMLSLLGLDHRQLTYLFEGRQRRLTDVGGNNDLSSRLTG